MNTISSYSKYFKYTSNFTYYAHHLFIMIISMISENVMGLSITQTPMFILVCILTTVITWIIYKLNINWMIKLIL